MKRKTNKTKEEAWSQTAHAPDGEQPGLLLCLTELKLLLILRNM